MKNDQESRKPILADKPLKIYGDFNEVLLATMNEYKPSKKPSIKKGKKK